MMKIFQSSVFSNDAVIYFDPDLIQVQDSHLEWLKTQGNVTYRDIPEDSLGRYIGDFTLVLLDMSVAPKFHRVVTLINGFKSPADYAGQQMRVLIPDISVLESITAVYMTGRRNLKLDQVQR